MTSSRARLFSSGGIVLPPAGDRTAKGVSMMAKILSPLAMAWITNCPTRPRDRAGW